MPETAPITGIISPPPVADLTLRPGSLEVHPKQTAGSVRHDPDLKKRYPRREAQATARAKEIAPVLRELEAAG